MSCKIKYNKSGVAKVFTPAGESSKLYQELLKFTGNQEEAIDFILLAYTDGFLNTIPNSDKIEPSITELLRYVDVKNSIDSKPKADDIIDILSVMETSGIENVEDLELQMNKVFKPNGYFTLDFKRIVDSNLYTPYEASIIVNNTEAAKSLQKVLEKVSGMVLRGEQLEVVSKPIDNGIKNTSELNSFGLYKKLTDRELENIVSKEVGGIKNREEFDIAVQNLELTSLVEQYNSDQNFADNIYNKYSTLVKINKAEISEGNIQAKKENSIESTLKSTILVNKDNTELREEIQDFLELEEQVKEENIKEVKEIIKDIEKLSADLGIDVVGLSEKPLEKVNNLLPELLKITTLAYTNSLSTEDIIYFSNKHLEVFNVNNTNDTTFENLPEKYSNLNLVQLYTELDADTLFSKFGAVKIGENVYHRVDNNLSTDTIYEFLFKDLLNSGTLLPKNITTLDINNPSNKPEILESIKNYTLSRNTGLEILDNDIAEKISGIQLIFEHEPLITVGTNKDSQLLKEVNTNPDYLKSDFVSDFYGYVLQEKVKNTKLYREILSNFEFNNKDISIKDITPTFLEAYKNNLSNIKLSKELQDYTKLKKGDPINQLAVENNVELENTTRSKIIANKNLLENYNGTIQLEEGFILTDSSDNFLRVGEAVLERVGDNVFREITPVPAENYNTLDAVTSFSENKVHQLVKENTFQVSEKKFEDLNDFESQIDNKVNIPEISNRSQFFKSLNNLNIGKGSFNFRGTEVFIDSLEISENITDNNITISSFTNVNDVPTVIGTLRLNRFEDGFIVDNAQVREDARGNGVGLELYKEALFILEAEGLPLYEDVRNTQAAKGVWNKLESSGLAKRKDGARVIRTDYSAKFSAGQEILIPQPKEIVTAIIDRLKLTQLPSDIILNKEELKLAVEKIDPEQYKLKNYGKRIDEDGILGVTVGDKVFINDNELNVNTPIHELGHLWAAWAKKNNTTLWNRGLKLIEGSTYLRDIQRESKNPESAYYNDSPGKVKEEALVRAIGDQGEAFVQQFVEKLRFGRWLRNLWKAIRATLSIRKASFEELQQMNLEQFSKAVAIDLLRGEAYVTKGYTIQPLLDQMLKNKAGKLVNKQVIRQILKQQDTKLIEKNIIEEVLDLPGFKKDDKISFDAFKLEVESRILPLEVIESQTYSNYGSDNVGVDLDTSSTNIYNSKLNHGLTGHFSGTFTEAKVFKEDNIQVVESEVRTDDPSNKSFLLRYGQYSTTKIARNANEAIDMAIIEWKGSINELFLEVRELQGNFAVIKSGVVLTQENLAENVLTVSPSREKAEDYIKNIQLSNSNNKGMFGHARVWQSGEDTYIAEIQSDSYQNETAKELLERSYQNDPSSLNTAQKKVYKKLDEANNVILKASSKVLTLDKTLSEKFAYIGKANSEKLKAEKELKKVEPISLEAQRLEAKIAKAEDAIEFTKKEIKLESLLYTKDKVELSDLTVQSSDGEAYRLPKNGIISKTDNGYQKSSRVGIRDFKTLEEALEDYQTEFQSESILKEDYENYFHASRSINKLQNELFEKASIQDKQFIAHRKNYSNRIIREEIKRNAEEGQKTLSLPTARTLALVEGYLSGSGEFGTPYEIIEASNHESLEPGDIIDYGGDEYMVIDSDSYNITVASKDEVYIIDDSYVNEEINYFTEEALDENDFNFNVESFTEEEWENKTVHHSLDGVELEDLADKNEDGTFNISEKLEPFIREYFEEIWSSPREYAVERYDDVYEDNYGTVYALEYGNNPETFQQPDEYDQAPDPETFEITDVDESYHGILKRHEKLVEWFSKERGDTVIVTDNNGNEWVQTDLTEEDGTAPVVVFQAKDLNTQIENKIKDINISLNNNINSLSLYSDTELKEKVDECRG